MATAIADLIGTPLLAYEETSQTVFPIGNASSEANLRASINNFIGQLEAASVAWTRILIWPVSDALEAKTDLVIAPQA